MGASRTARVRDAIATAWQLPLRAGLASLTLLVCTGPGAADPPSADAGPLTPGALRVRLVFGAASDLDLYVTGPARETVYFANPTSHDGGALAADRRCDASAPRVEQVTFSNAPPGVYRVGVDFMVRCDGSTDAAPYVVWIEAPGREAQRVEGVARFGVFEPKVAELLLDAPTP